MFLVPQVVVEQIYIVIGLFRDRMIRGDSGRSGEIRGMIRGDPGGSGKAHPHYETVSYHTLSV